MARLTTVGPYSRGRRLAAGLLGGALLVGGSAALAGPEAVRSFMVRPFGVRGTTVLPDRYLRAWDPITIFFADAHGAPGPEDHPERWASLSPSRPGAWSWVDSRTLQFRPAEPWPPLAVYTVNADRTDTRLATYAAPPLSVAPAPGSVSPDPVDQLELSFPDAIDPAVLARMLEVELRPLPGLDPGTATWRSAREFRVKRLDTSSLDLSGGVDTAGGLRDEGPPPVAYAVLFDTPIPLDTRVIVHLRLSQDEGAATEEGTNPAVQTWSFATAAPFRVTDVGCGGRWLTVPSAGTVHAAESPLVCSRPELRLAFSARPGPLTPVDVRNLVSVLPAVEGIDFRVEDKQLVLTGPFLPDRAYTVRISPTLLADAGGRPLALDGATTLTVGYTEPEGYARLVAADGVVERYGAQTIPVESRGETQLDLRIYRIDPLDAAFWPFDGQPLVVDESRRPPGPGEEPVRPGTDASERVEPSTRAQLVQLLGSPPVSALVPLPVTDGDAHRLGLDLSAHLARIAGPGASGTYLVGIRRPEAGPERSYMRLQVTDLSLTTVEEVAGVRYVVTSLATGGPVSGASVRLEGQVSGGEPAWATLASVTTGADGTAAWKAPGRDADSRRTPRRIVVEKGPDTLVLNADRAPAAYQDNHWSSRGERWLGWAFDKLDSRAPAPQTLCHVWTERPVYRPEEKVYVQGWVRTRVAGELAPLRMPGTVQIDGPGGLRWRVPLETDADGGFFYIFEADDRPSGSYLARYQTDKGAQLCQVAFQTEAFRLPDFSVDLHGPAQAAMDTPFEVKLLAGWYAGGAVAGRPVRWRVTQYPATWQPPQRAGFVFSSDSRYSTGAEPASDARIASEGRTDAQGAATLAIDPTVEADTRPRTYVVEATVTGEDAQTVTTSRRYEALPPTVLGLKVARYLEATDGIPVEAVVTAPDGALRPGQRATLRLFRREWHSVVQASDLEGAEPRYRTDAVDILEHESPFESGATPTKLRLPAPRSGVYVVELESRDRRNRAQVVRTDLYVAGDEPVAWEKPQAGLYTLTADRDSYDPGTTASIVVHSPYTNARALVITEAPEGNRYQWVDVRGGSATIKVPVQMNQVPRLPVHVVLMRGRAGEAIERGPDLGKPATVASTAWLVVNPVENQVAVTVTNPARSEPGRELPITVRLATPKGRPVAGTVALWLVDAAVLALGKEQRLDPLPSFITQTVSRLVVRDTRNLIFGRLPVAPAPGGDGGGESGILEKTTIRKDFKSVPYYEPHVVVGASGTVTVRVKLPDNLTVFKIRAKAAAGPDRFGAGTSEVAVRLPVVVQPAFPRFVRAGDHFEATALGRAVEAAPGGASGAAEIVVEGLTLSGPSTQLVSLDPAAPTALRFPVTVPSPTFDAEGRPTRSSVRIRIGVRRNVDGAADAVEVTLPLREDRPAIVNRTLLELVPGVPSIVAGLLESARPGTIRRLYAAASDPAVLRAAGAVQAMAGWPNGDTAAAVGRGRSWLALGGLRRALDPTLADSNGSRPDAAVRAAIEGLTGCVDARGLVAAFPGGEGRVWLTATTYGFLTEARAAGFAVPEALYTTLGDALGRSLRSDAPGFLPGEAWVERARALEALAGAGRLDAAYFAELARTAQFSDAEGVAAVVLAATGGDPAMQVTATGLVPLLNAGIGTRLQGGREVYAGLLGVRGGRDPRILPAEVRTLATIVRAIARVDARHPRLPLLREALVQLGGADGWGAPDTDAAAILALTDRLTEASGGWSVQVADGGRAPVLTPPAAREGLPSPAEGARGVASVATTTADRTTLTLTGASPVGVWVETRYVPAADASAAAPVAAGFVVDRSLGVIASTGLVERHPLEAAGPTLRLASGSLVEDQLRFVNPQDRAWVAVHLPLAAGLEALNPRLATAPPEARPSVSATRSADWTDWRDDEVVWYYERLPAGTYTVAVRARATVPGSFLLPPARVEGMNDAAIHGSAAGARVEISGGR